MSLTRLLCRTQLAVTLWHLCMPLRTMVRNRLSSRMVTLGTIRLETTRSPREARILRMHSGDPCRLDMLLIQLISMQDRSTGKGHCYQPCSPGR